MTAAHETAMFDLLGEACAIVEADGSVTGATRAFAAWPGTVPERARIAHAASRGSAVPGFVERIDGRWGEVVLHPLPGDRMLVLVRDVDDRVRAQEEVKRLRLRVLTIQEDERRSISQNLHDELGQGMTALGMRVGSLLETTEDAALAQSLTETRAQVELITKRMRQLFYRIRPPGLHDETLSAALADYCASVAHSSGLGIVYDAAPELPNLEGAEATALYRLLQEALTNVIRHARAESAWVTLSCDEESVTLAVEDDGAGFDPAVKASGIGLAGMRERFQMVDGDLVVDTRPGSGTRISGSVPLPERRGARG